MNMEEIRKIARQLKVKSAKLKKHELVQAIQLAEGNNPCYNTSISTFCNQQSCCWREDCR